MTALRGVSLALAAGSFTSVMGPSGSGKSTLLQCAAGLDEPTSGQVFVDAAEVPRGDEAEITRFRRERIGFVFQQYNLIPYLTVTQNVTLRLKFAGQASGREAAGPMLARLVLDDLARRLPSSYPRSSSGGHRRRLRDWRCCRRADRRWTWPAAARCCRCCVRRSTSSGRPW